MSTVTRLDCVFSSANTGRSMTAIIRTLRGWHREGQPPSPDSTTSLDAEGMMYDEGPLHVSKGAQLTAAVDDGRPQMYATESDTPQVSNRMFFIQCFIN